MNKLAVMSLQEVIDVDLPNRFIHYEHQPIDYLNRDVNRRSAKVFIWLLLVSVLLPASLAAQNSSAAQGKRGRSAPLDLNAIDYLHYWVIPKSQRGLRIDSVYSSADHAEIFESAQVEAAKQGSERFRALLATNERLYETGMSPTGTPFFYTVFGLVQTGNFERDLKNFQIASAILFSAGICLLGRAAGLRLWVCLAILVALFVLFGPLRVDSTVGNTNRLQVFLFAVFAWLVCKKRPALFPGAIFLGFAVAFKLTFVFVPAFALTCLLSQRRVRSACEFALGAALGFLGAVLIGSGYFGSLRSWQLWQKYVTETLKQPFPIEHGNLALLRLLDVNSASLTLAIVGVLWLALLAATILRQKFVYKGDLIYNGNGKGPDLNRDLVLWGAAGLLVFLVSSPLVWAHYYLLAVPAIVLLPSYFRSQQENTVTARAILGLLAAGSILVAAIPQKLFAMSDPYVLAISLQLGTLCLFGGTVLALLSHRNGLVARGRGSKAT